MSNIDYKANYECVVRDQRHYRQTISHMNTEITELRNLANAYKDSLDEATEEVERLKYKIQLMTN